LFIVINVLFIVHNIYLVNLLPLALLFLLAGIFSMDKLMMMVVFFTPLSLNFTEMLGRRVNPDLSIPAEPMLFGILLLFVFKLIQGYRVDKKIMRHPITVLILIQFAWITITTLTSTMPVISFKFLIARLWLVVPTYFITTLLFKDVINIKRFMWLYIIPLTYVIFYTIYQHSLYAFEERPANWVVKPFYNDHTAYGAMLAMFIPVLIGFLYLKKNSTRIKTITFVLLGIFILATVLSYTRAAWVGLAVALIMLILLKWKVKFRTLLILFFGLVGIFIVFQGAIMLKLKENKQDSSSNFSDHIESIANVSTDASNKERLNRWSCALRMFKVYPVFGFGPGTYSFQYAPYQVKSEETIISTDFGDAGNAHSEYLGPLAETGFMGTLIFLVMTFLIIATGMRLYYTLVDKELKLLTCVILLGLVTYFVHGCLNNFLDTDKASVPFWGFVAMLTAIDIYHNKKGEQATSLFKPTAE
jgi:putative inorganic carbon (HCO3(-)) transporter